MEKLELQNIIDVEKWLASEAAHEDKCGSYYYCKYCDKSIEYPCAVAMEKWKTHKKVRLSFMQKLDKAKDEVKAAYAELISHIESKGLKIVVSNRWVSVRKNNLTIVKFTITKNLLKFRLSLDPQTEEFSDDEFPRNNDGDKKSYVRVPFTFRITSPGAIENAKILFDSICD